MTIDYLAKKTDLDCDTEAWPNYWSIGFRDDAGRVKVFELFDGHPLDRTGMARIFKQYRIYTFNGLNYDVPMILYAMKGATNEELKRLNDELIPKNKGKDFRPKIWEIMDKYDLQVPEFFDHIDLMPMAPAAAQKFSLKKYAGTMHSQRMQELPFHFDKVLTREDIEVVRSYHGNDLVVNGELRRDLAQQSKLRAEISARYNFDFRSKSDAQCGEAVVKLLVERAKGVKRIYKADIKPGPFKYVAPAYIKFKTPALQQVLSDILRSNFVVRHDGYVDPPDMFAKKKGAPLGSDDADASDVEYEGGSEIRIGSGVYKMGIGGLHSQEEKVSYWEDEKHDLSDNDVTSFYPWLMIMSMREPDNMKGFFRAIFKGLVLERVRAKAASARAYKAGDKVEGDKWKAVAESLKIFINGLFGKTGSPYSIVYSPSMMIQTTVTGQLTLLMLIEECFLRGFEVVSANTDGFITRVPKDRRDEFRAVIFDWECDTGLDTEETFYRSYHAANVNNYVAFKKKQDKDGNFTGELEAKLKGMFAESGRGTPASAGLKKTPTMEICNEAAIAFLHHGTPVETTIRNCTDIRKFVVVRAVQGGGQKDGKYIGKVVRYYHGTDSRGAIHYVTSGNRVPKSGGAVPCMELPDELPDDIDYELYEREAYARLDDMGVQVADPVLRGRKGFVLGHRDDQKTVHTIDAATGVALCGAVRKSRRELWVEVPHVADDMRSCAKCRKAVGL